MAFHGTVPNQSIQKMNGNVKWAGIKPNTEDSLAHLTARADAMHIRRVNGIWLEIDAAGNTSNVHTDAATGDYIPAFRVTHISNETAWPQAETTDLVYLSVPGRDHVPCRMQSGWWRDIWVTRVYTTDATMDNIVLWA
jgi:hypothetical protein